MKKAVIILLAAALILSMTACGKTPAAPADHAGSSSSETAQPEDNTQAQNENTEQAIGKLNRVEPREGKDAVSFQLCLAGNRTGSEAFNCKAPSTEGIRSVFELNEWISFYPETDQSSGIRVWIMEHRDDPSAYEAMTFSEETPGFAAFCDLTKGDDGNPWGEVYLQPDDCQPGYYDFVFTFEGDVFATLLTRFYNENELDGKTDAELEALMQAN